MTLPLDPAPELGPVPEPGEFSPAPSMAGWFASAPRLPVTIGEAIAALRESRDRS